MPPLEAGEKVGQDNLQLDQDFYDRLSQVLGERIRQCGHRVPVVTGKMSKDCEKRGFAQVLFT